MLHYAHLCAAAGGVDAFLIGTEMPGLTTIRSGASAYPAVQAYRDLLADVRSILGSGTKIGYTSLETRVMAPAFPHVLISSFLETRRRQIVASVTVRFPGGSSQRSHRESHNASA